MKVVKIGKMGAMYLLQRIILVSSKNCAQLLNSKIKNSLKRKLR